MIIHTELGFKYKLAFLLSIQVVGGELKLIKITLQLANRSKGEIEDVLIEVGEFIFSVDFIIVETALVENPKGQIPLILGRPFLVTSNALINYRSGLMKLTFENMTINLNIFNLGKQPRSDQPFEVNLVQEFPSEHFEEEGWTLSTIITTLSLMKWKDGSVRWKNK